MPLERKLVLSKAFEKSYQKFTSKNHLLKASELAMYKRLKKSFEQIKLHQEGKIKLKTIEEVLAELS
jgi:hypothetical protein